jgi:polar amino acid transport system substrate-binding protein
MAVGLLALGLVVAGLGEWPGGAPAFGQSLSADGQIPNFWDPRRRVARPLPGALESIRFITTDDFPPFNFVDDSGRLTGFHVDLARAICDELAIPCTIQARPFDNLITSIEKGTADAAIAGIAISGENRQKLDFSDVYLTTPARFVVTRANRGADVSPEGLVGRSVGVVSNSAHEAFLGAYYPAIQRRLYATPDAARAGLKNGEIYAYFGDAMQLSFWLLSESAETCCNFAGGPYLDSHFFGNGLAIAVRRNAPDLRDAIDSALDALHSSGVYGELYLRYFPLGFF